MSSISFLIFSSLACPPAGKKRNHFLPNLISTNSCLCWNPGSSTGFAQCCSQRLKKARLQGQPRPLLKSLKWENLECNSTSCPKSQEAACIWRKGTKVTHILMPVIQGERNETGLTFSYPSCGVRKSRVISRTFPWRFFFNWITELHKLFRVRMLTWWLKMSLKAPLEALPALALQLSVFKPKQKCYFFIKFSKNVQLYSLSFGFVCFFVFAY